MLHESEAILNQMPGGAFQQKMTRAVTFQVQKIIIKSWRKEWKRSLREYEEEQKVPLPERISELADSYCSEHQVQSRCFQRIVSCLQPQSCLRVRATTRSLRT